MLAAGRAACVLVAVVLMLGGVYQLWVWNLTLSRLFSWALWAWLVWAAAVFLGSLILYHRDFYGRTLSAAWRQLSLPGIVTAAALYMVKAYVLKTYADHSPRFMMGSEDYLGQLLMSPLLFPGVNLVAALFLAGPVILLFVLAYGRLAGRSLDWGAAAALWFLAFSLLCIDSETRRLNGFLPFLAVLAAAAVPAAFLSTRNLFYMALLALLFSKVWFPMNAFGNPFPNKEVTHPLAQLYFMHQGPFIYDTQLYTGMAVGALAALAACALMLRRAKRTP